jgi:L-threonylcarbamoyladenylate synthase
LSCEIGTDIEYAAELLQAGQVIAFPTETVYGLGGLALDPAAVAQIFQVKQRPSFDPLITHVHDFEQLHDLSSDVSSLVQKLAEQYWPGPLTMILPKRELVPDLVTAGLPFVGIRMPAHPMAIALLKRVQAPVAAPSANLFTRLSPTTAEHVHEQLGAAIPYILDGGPCQIGVESTVVRVQGDEIELLRLGGLPVEELEAFLGRKIPQSVQHLDHVASMSPGQHHRHYAPRIPLQLVDESELMPVVRSALSRARRVGVMTFSEPVPAEFLANHLPWMVTSPQRELAEATAHFFQHLRQLDAIPLDVIIATRYPEHGLGKALNDRLLRGSQRR